MRATAPAQPPTSDATPTEALLRDDQLDETQPVYRDLGRILRHGRSTSYAEPPAATEPIRTRFVVDILSGSSAGGINGIFLAKALATDAPLDRLKQIWVDEGDMLKLIDDEESYAGTELERLRPSSVLNSRRMYWLLLDAFGGMDDRARSPQTGSRLVDELDLWITATDLNGLLLPIGLYDKVVYEPRHRSLFHFRYANRYSSNETLEPENQLTAEANPVLAFAARATSSFPFAFEPMELRAIDPIVASRTFSGEYGAHPSSDPQWRRFFRPYVAAEGPSSPYPARQYGDGGYLDNKPFTAPTANLLTRRSDVPVDRKLIYVEPDPGTLHGTRIEPGLPPAERVPEADVRPLKHFDALQNVLAALIALPRKEPIREDLELILQRNRDVARLRRAVDAIDAAIAADEDWKPLSKDEWLAATASETAETYGFQHAAYRRLKFALLLDDLAETAALLAGLDPNSDEQSAIRCFIQAWFDDGYKTSTARRQFLVDFDLPYRVRRIDFLQTRIDELLEGDDSDPLQNPLYALKRELTTILVTLIDTGRSIRRRADTNPAYQAFRNVTLSPTELLSVLGGARDEADSVKKAREILNAKPELRAQIDDLAAKVREGFAPVFDGIDVRTTIAAHEAEAPAAVAQLLRAYDRYELYDSVIVPISYGAVGESDRVEVIRVSPEDAWRIVDETKSGRRKLGGIELGHFGGFFRADWRRNDLMWGRLDAAERIVDTLLGPEDATAELKDALIHRAHVAIVRAERGLQSDAEAEAALEELRTQDVSRDIPEGEMEEIVGRAAVVAGEVLQRTPSGGRPLAMVGGLVKLGGRLETGPWRTIFVASLAALAVLGIALFVAGLAGAGTWVWALGLALACVSGGALAALVLLRRAAGGLGRARPPRPA